MATGQETTSLPSWTYMDVMTTATALIPSNHLLAEDELWVGAWGEIVSRKGTRELLPDLAAAPVSASEAVRDEVEELRRVLLRAGFAALENPSYDYVTLREGAKLALCELHRDLIEAHGPALREMAGILDDRLSVGEGAHAG